MIFGYIGIYRLKKFLDLKKYLNSVKKEIEAENKIKYAEESFLEEIKKYYNGYRFSESLVEKVYNPFSILNFLENKYFENFWFATGTPTFLI